MNVAIVGGGAAGSVAAVTLAKGGIAVTLFEKNEKIGKKLYITGKGRCNLTNACDAEEMLSNVVHGDKYLRSAAFAFTPEDTMALFESLGVPLKVERGNRVFPASDKSSDVIRALERALKLYKVEVKLNEKVDEVRYKNGVFALKTAVNAYEFDRVIVATGGLTYPSTGSTGDGYAIAKAFGHAVVEPKPSLTQLVTTQDVSSLDGLSLKNVRLSAYSAGKAIASEFGEALFTSKGISGPIALTVSAYINRLSGVKLSLDLKPALDEKTLEERILRDFDERKNSDLKNVTRALLPARLNMYVLQRAEVSADKKVNSVTKEERRKLVATVKALTFDVEGTGSFNEAVVTSGGVDLKQLKPTGESRLRAGLYFVGETADVDALTGGFNLQIAFSTAVAAAKDILKKA